MSKANELSNDVKHHVENILLSEWIELVPGELPVDAVGLWQIIPELRRDFGLEGDALVTAVRATLRALLDHGAKPVIGGRGTAHSWIEQTQYGSAPDEIVTNLIIEWCAWGMGNPTVDAPWFALPKMIG